MGRIEGESKGEKSNRRLRGGKKRVLCGGVEAGEVERLREEKELREEKMVVRERERRWKRKSGKKFGSRSLIND